jgi:hypothetical protein
VRRIVDRLRAEGELSPEQFVDRALDLIGPLDVSERNRDALIAFAQKGGPLNLAEGGRDAEQRVGELLQVIVATREFQLT